MHYELCIMHCLKSSSEFLWVLAFAIYGVVVALDGEHVGIDVVGWLKNAVKAHNLLLIVEISKHYE